MRKTTAAVAVALMIHGFAHAADSPVTGTGTADAAGTADGKGASGSTHAQTWAAQAQLGVIVTSGSTTTKSGNASFDAAHRMGRWTLSGGARALYASTGHYTTQQDTNAHLQADLALSQRIFWFSAARWDRNLFTGFAYQESIASGGGFKFLHTPATTLAGELGVGYRREQPEILTLGALGNVTSRARQAVVGDAVLQAGLNYSHAITHLTKLENTLLVQYGSSDTTTTDDLSLQVKVDSSLSLALGVRLVNNTSPPPGSAVHTDTVMTINLVYAVHNAKLSATSPAPVNVSGFDLP